MSNLGIIGEAAATIYRSPAALQLESYPSYPGWRKWFWEKLSSFVRVAGMDATRFAIQYFPEFPNVLACLWRRS